MSGAALLIAFGGFKWWTGSQSAAGLDAFEEARTAIAEATPQQETISPVTTSGTANDQDWAARLESHLTSEVDTSLWSSTRIKEHDQAVQAASDAPQAVLQIEHLNIRVPVYNGASDQNLNRGVARIIGTSQVGEAGNLGIAGHRDSFFRPLKDISLGDRFTLETLSGTEVYEVSSIEIIEPSELRVLAPTKAPTVTLVTCYPFYHVGSAPQRFIVKAEALENQVNS